MDEPVDYQQVADYLRETRQLASVPIATPFWSTWLDNTKAKFLLGWRPRFDLERLIDESWATSETRTIRGESGIRDRSNS